MGAHATKNTRLTVINKMLVLLRLASFLSLVLDPLGTAILLGVRMAAEILKWSFHSILCGDCLDCDLQYAMVTMTPGIQY